MTDFSRVKGNEFINFNSHKHNLILFFFFFFFIREQITDNTSSAARLLSDPNVVELVDLLKSVVSPKQLENVNINVNHQTQLLPTKTKKSTNQQKRKEKRRKNKTLTRKEYADLGLFTLPTNSIKYNDLLPLHNLWIQYIREFLSLTSDTKVPQIFDVNYENFSKLLNKIDFHGAQLTVIRSKCPSLVGVNGIVAMDTKNTFKICGKDNKLRSN